MQRKILPIKDIIVDTTIYPREHQNEKIIKEYAACLKRGDTFPLIYIAKYKGKYLLVDGLHRLEANKVVGEQFVQTEIKTNFPSKKDILLASIRSNLKHGQRFTKKDKLRSMHMMAEMKFETEDISKLLHLDLQEVTKLTGQRLNLISLKRNLKSKKLPRVFRQKMEREEARSIEPEEEPKLSRIDNSGFEELRMPETAEINPADYQLDELSNIYDYLKKEKLDIDNRKIRNKITQIKKLLKKRYSKL